MEAPHRGVFPSRLMSLKVGYKLSELSRASRVISGWWYTYTSEKYEFVSWDDDIPN